MARMQYVERQVAIRGRIASWMCVLFALAVFVNGWVVEEWKAYGSGMQQAFTIV